MVAVHQLFLLFGVTASCTELAAAEHETPCERGAEPAACARTVGSKNLVLMQVKSKVSRNVARQRLSPTSQWVKRISLNTSKERSPLAFHNASSGGHSASAGGGGPSTAQVNTSGSGVSGVQAADAGRSRDIGAKISAVLAQHSTALRNCFADLVHRFARSQGTLSSTSVWITTTLTVMVIVGFVAWVLVCRRPHSSSVPVPLFLRGAQQRGLLSGKATPRGGRSMRGSMPSLGETGRHCRSPAESGSAAASLAAVGRELPAAQLPSGAGAETVASLPFPSPIHPSTAATNNDSTLTVPARSSSVLSDDTSGVHPYFCHDLVVPPGCECILNVPLKCPIQGPCEARDLNGIPVIRIESCTLPQGGGASEGLLKLVLTTEYGNVVAQCMPSPARIAGKSPEREQCECALISASGDVFALIKKDEGERDRYTLATKMDGQLRVSGSRRERALNVVDRAGRLVAKTSSMMDQPSLIPPGAVIGQHPQVSLDPDQDYFTLRVAPLMDVGLILCLLLCIQHLME